MKSRLNPLPGVDLWRDTYAFVANRVSDAWRGLLKQMPRSKGGRPSSLFLRIRSDEDVSHRTGHGQSCPPRFSRGERCFRTTMQDAPI